MRQHALYYKAITTLKLSACPALPSLNNKATGNPTSGLEAADLSKLGKN